MSDQTLLKFGKVSGVFGIKGWIKVFSFTDPRDNILKYSPWILVKNSDSKTVKIIAGKLQGGSVIVQLDGFDSRNLAETLIGYDIMINQKQLPETQAGEFYWSDLIGLEVTNLQGIILGKVESLMETGANDVLIIQGDRERAVPFLQGQTIVNIDLAEGCMLVDWDAEF